MATTIDDDLVVSGALSAANILFGSTTISPEVNTPTSSEVTTNHPDSGDPIVMVAAVSREPWTSIREVSQRFAEPTGFTIYVYRTSDLDVTINWLSWQVYTP